MFSALGSRTRSRRAWVVLLVTVKADPVCRLLVSVPGVGPVTALAFRTAVEDPARFAKSSLVGAHFGMTPRQYASGETDRMVKGR